MSTDKARATKSGSAFRMDCAISASIHAPPEKIWALLTDAAGFPRWNSTVTSIEGEIAEGKTLKIKGSLPDFVPIFEAYAEDLKRAAEGGAA